MGWTIFGIILLVLAFVGLIVWRTLKSKLKVAKARADERAAQPRDRYTDPYADRRESRDLDGLSIATRVALGVTVALFGLGGLTVFLNTFTITAPRTVDIPVLFGKPQEPVAPGWNWVNPFSDIETVDATTQNINRNTDIGRWNNEHVCTAIAVRLANNTTACVDLTGQWNVDQTTGGDASRLWQSYRGTNNALIENLSNNVVSRELQRAMNRAFEQYDPLAVLTSGGSEPGAPDTAALSAEVLADLQRSVDRGIIVDKLLISMVHFDKVTQEKLDNYAQALADTRIATQEKLTAEQIRLANEILAQNAATSNPGVMFQNCLAAIDRLADAGQLGNLPTNTIVCALSGDGAPIIVDTRSTP